MMNLRILFCKKALGMEVSMKGRLSTVDLLAMTSLNRFRFKLKMLFTFVIKQATLMRR
jgi:hypothetical protein